MISPPRFAVGAHVIWRGQLGTVVGARRWTNYGYAYDVRLHGSLLTTLAESVLDAAPANVVAPGRWARRPAFTVVPQTDGVA